MPRPRVCFSMLRTSAGAILKPKFKIGERVIVKGPRAGLKREMVIEEIRITIRAKVERVQYGFKESLWLYSESAIEGKVKAQIEFEDEGFFL